jgi:glycine oxidase
MTTKQTIAVRGAGIMGLMAAYSLKNALPDTDVSIYDPLMKDWGSPADNASYMAGGMLAPYAEIEHMDMDWVRAGLASIDIWQNTPLDTEFSRQGSLLITHNEDRHILERFKTHLPNDVQTPVNGQEIEPALHERFQSGVLIESEAHLNPHKTMQSLCNWLSDNNVRTIQSAEEPENTDWTIDCRGMGANDPDIRGVKGETLLVRNHEFELSRPVRLMHPRYPLYIIPRGDGIFMIGATVIESADNENVSLRSSMELMSALYALSPSFGEAEIIELKAGIRPSYADNLPRIRTDESKKTINCNGLFRHGYLLAPVMAQCVADHVLDKENEFMPLFNKGLNDESHDKRAA